VQDPSVPRLWQFRVSHYNEKARWGLDYKRWPHHRRTLLPGFHVPVARWKSGQQKLPILEIDGQVVAGSDRILRILEQLRPDPSLFPADPAARLRALAIQAYFDEEVAPEWRRLFWATYLDDAPACTAMATDGAAPAARLCWAAALPLMRPLFRRNMKMDPASLERARARMGTHLDKLLADIGAHGYLVGDSFTVADLTAAAVLTAIIRPPQFSYPLPEPWPAALVELRASIAQHSAFDWVLNIYTRHRGPSFELAAPAAA
jgi:glutathione S-transferase